MKKLILFLAFLTANTFLFAQLYEISLDQKIDESQIIVEGKVVKDEAFIGNDDRIYTAHKIEIQRILKGVNFRGTHLTIVTRGGEIDERITTWSHLLTLREGEAGIFFLQETNQPVPSLRGFPSTNFEVFSSSQGFLKYTEGLGGQVAASPFQKYEDIENSLIKPIALRAGENIKELVAGKNKEEGKKCIIYTFEPILGTAFNPIKIGADIKVRSPQGSFDLFKSLVIVEYDTLFFGSNVASNGTIELYDGDISGMSNYNLTVTDLAANKVEIKLTSIGSANQLFTITEQKSFLARVYLQIANPFGTGIVSFDNDAMEQGNLYYDPSTSTTKPFNCITIENEVFPSACPIILSFNPPTAAAGVGQQSLNDPPIPGVITIVGENFGTPGINEYKPPHIKLGFTNAGPSGADWCFPPERDIISWSEDTIVVRVPSLNEDGDIKTYSGTGQLLIWNTDEDCFSYSTDSLYVPFAVTNRSNLYSPSQTRESILTKMVDANGEGGYDLYFGDNILTLDSVEQSFERALNTWRCTTKVNMVIKPKSEIADLSKACLIDLDTTGTNPKLLIP